MTGRIPPAFLALVGVALLLSAPLAAQDTTPPEQRAEMRAGSPAMMAAMRGAPGPAALGLALEHAEYLELSAEQRERLESLRAEHAQASEAARSVITAHRVARRTEMHAEMQARRDSLRDERDATRQERREEMQQRMQAMDRQRLRQDTGPRPMRSTPRSTLRHALPSDLDPGMTAEVREAHATLLRLQRESVEGLREILDAEQLRALRTLTAVAAVDRVRPMQRPRIRSMSRPMMQQRQRALSMRLGPARGDRGRFWR